MQIEKVSTWRVEKVSLCSLNSHVDAKLSWWLTRLLFTCNFYDNLNGIPVYFGR